MSRVSGLHADAAPDILGREGDLPAVSIIFNSFYAAYQYVLTRCDQNSPPTYEAHLSGVPGFTANIDYEVSATVTRRKTSLFGFANT